MARGSLYIVLGNKKDNCDEINYPAACPPTEIHGDLEAFLGSLDRPCPNGSSSKGFICRRREGMRISDWLRLCLHICQVGNGVMVRVAVAISH